ncbi:hypothetical protein [Calothrix sp. UHCC 0171]|nr:hypothetical protein [Calothrix sp. UHCC 0171]MEA5569574.1 hypothetical protein [Calothrix sp. UHCC 0171]
MLYIQLTNNRYSIYIYYLSDADMCDRFMREWLNNERLASVGSNLWVVAV